MGLRKLLILSVLACVPGAIARAQNARTEATGVQALQLSAFGGVTATYTGLESGRNLGITAGGDLSFRPHFGLFPAIEIRGNYGADQGHVVGERSILGGLKVEKRFGRLKPYLDVTFGRGQLNYVTPLPNVSATYYYIQTTSNVFSPGGGLDLAVSHHFDLKGDVQVQQWSTPVTAGHHFYSEPLTLGIVYKFDFNRGRMP